MGQHDNTHSKSQNAWVHTAREEKTVYFGVIDGQDTGRLRHAYADLFLEDQGE